MEGPLQGDAAKGLWVRDSVFFKIANVFASLPGSPIRDYVNYKFQPVAPRLLYWPTTYEYRTDFSGPSGEGIDLVSLQLRVSPALRVPFVVLPHCSVACRGIFVVGLRAGADGRCGASRMKYLDAVVFANRRMLSSFCPVRHCKLACF